MFQNYTLDEIYNERTTTIISLLYNIITIIHFSMIPFVVYLILTKSKNITVYKWYILCEILFCTTTQLIFVSMKLMLLCPLPIVISIGPLENLLASNPNLLITLVEIGFYSLIHFGLILMFASLYRLAVLLNLEKIVPFFEQLRYVISWIVCVEISILTILYFGIEQYRHSANLLLFDEKTIEEHAPFLKSLASKHQIFGFRDTDYTTEFSMMLGAAIAILLAAIFISIVPKFFIERAKHLRSEQTFKMQLMLYKSVLIQSWNCLLLILTSVSLVCIITLFEIRKTTIFAQLLVAFMELHGVLDLCFIMYFITPYRKFIKEKIRCFQNPNQVINLIQQPTTSMPNREIVEHR